MAFHTSMDTYQQHQFIIPKWLKVPQKQQRAAENLGAVYLSMKNQWHPDLPFDSWAIPEEVSFRPGRPSLNSALRGVYLRDPDTGESRKYINPPYLDVSIPYKMDYALVMPAVKEQALQFTKNTLYAETIQLGNLLHWLEREPGLPGRLQEAANEIARKAGGFYETEQDIVTAEVRRASARGYVPPGSEEAIKDSASALSNKGMKEYYHDRSISLIKNEEKKLDDEKNKLTRQRIAKAVHELMLQRIAKHVNESSDEVEVAKVLSILFLHPQGISILASYSKNPITGNQYAMDLVKDAIRSIAGFHHKIAAQGNEDHIWRYPLLVTKGVEQLGLDNIPGFTEYAVNVGQVLGQSEHEKLIDFAGIAILCLGLVFTGPVGVLVLSAADLALAGAGGAFAYMREREQELGAEASAFRGENEQFATSTGYLDTALAGAAALLSGIAFFQATKEFRELLKAKPKNIAEVLAPKEGAVIGRPRADSAPVDATATSGRKVDEGSRGLGAKPLESKTGSNGVPSRPTEIAQPSENRCVTATSAKDDQARAIVRAEEITGIPNKQPTFNDPYGMRPDATNFDRQTAGAGGIESISFLKDPEGSYAVKIKGELQEGLYRGKGAPPPGRPSIKARNYNRSSKFISNKEAGLTSDWENLHLWGPGFGDEAAAGMMKGPKEVNQFYQNRGVEGYMRDLRDLALKKEGRVELEATAIAWDLKGASWQPKLQVDFLKRAEYKATLHLPGKAPQTITITIDVAQPPSAKVLFDVHPSNAINPGDLF